MGNASGHSGWRIRARVGLAMARGGEGDSGATVSVVPALEGAYGPLHLVQRKRGVERVLTVLWVEGKAGAVCSATRIGGGGTCGGAKLAWRRSRGATGQSGVEAAALGFVGRRLLMGEQGGAARATYRAAAALACVHAVGKPARTAARISAARRGRRGAGVWGHGVSGSGRLRALRS